MKRLATGMAIGVALFMGGAAWAISSPFVDVTDAHPVDAIEWAVEQGITRGYTETEFRPDEPLKRSHAVIFIERFYDKVLGANGDDQFTNPDFTRADMMVLLYEMSRQEVPQTTTTTISSSELTIVDHYWSADGRFYFVVLDNVPRRYESSTLRSCDVYMTQGGRRTGDRGIKNSDTSRMTVQVRVKHPADGFEVEC